MLVARRSLARRRYRRRKLFTQSDHYRIDAADRSADYGVGGCKRESRLWRRWSAARSVHDTERFRPVRDLNPSAAGSGRFPAGKVSPARQPNYQVAGHRHKADRSGRWTGGITTPSLPVQENHRASSAERASAVRALRRTPSSNAVEYACSGQRIGAGKVDSWRAARAGGFLSAEGRSRQVIGYLRGEAARWGGGRSAG